MSNKIEKITNSLIKLYSGGSLRSEMKFRKKLESIDWDKEQKKLKSILIITNIAFIITIVCFMILFISFILGLNNPDKQEMSLAPAISIFAGYISTSIGFNLTSERYKVFKLLRELMEN